MYTVVVLSEVVVLCWAYSIRLQYFHCGYGITLLTVCLTGGVLHIVWCVHTLAAVVAHILESPHLDTRIQLRATCDTVVPWTCTAGNGDKK